MSKRVANLFSPASVVPLINFKHKCVGARLCPLFCEWLCKWAVGELVDTTTKPNYFVSIRNHSELTVHLAYVDGSDNLPGLYKPSIGDWIDNTIENSESESVVGNMLELQTCWSMRSPAVEVPGSVLLCIASFLLGKVLPSPVFVFRNGSVDFSNPKIFRCITCLRACQ